MTYGPQILLLLIVRVSWDLQPILTRPNQFLKKEVKSFTPHSFHNFPKYPNPFFFLKSVTTIVATSIFFLANFQLLSRAPRVPFSWLYLSISWLLDQIWHYLIFYMLLEIVNRLKYYLEWYNKVYDSNNRCCLFMRNITYF